MKKTALIFAVCFAALGLQGAMADDADTARAATRRTNTAPSATGGVTSAQTTTTRAKVSKPASTTTTPPTTSRTTATAPAKTTQKVTSRTATNVGPRDGNVISNTNRNSSGGNVTRQSATAARTATGARTSVPTTQTGNSTARTATTGRTRGAITSGRGATAARAADTSALRDTILKRDYTKCRTVYYDCMDEFCANKDSQLKRCACSSRIHEFDNVKKRLNQAEEKMLDFSERLLTVNMDKEDAAALFTATEGEVAFNNTKDTSDSKKILNEISKKLKTNSTDDSFNQSLESISLSLNMDSAFDSVDSLQGASTTTKEGTALYGAALPICREMAAEICDEYSLELAVSGYQMAIEQDCNTVSKTYLTQADQAREKIREGSALLDMSRLDIHQKRNSDDILTCKKKMLTQLSNTSVCGENLSKCLDMTGRYVDPSTGQAFLTENLADLASLITRPTGDESWSSAPGSTAFVKYLQTKKKFLDPATENCQNIADDVWDMFLEDALAQIKLAQEAKLEEVRQSCTTLTTQCLSNTAKSLADFDARALSTFGVAADKTVNAMCDSIKNSCTTLMNATVDDTTADNDWVGGMTQIATEKTYDTILQTCREVGRACIIQVCKSVSGNFGLCENIDTSINRKSIINRTACWSEVLKCVRSAGTDSISRIFELETKVSFDRDENDNLLNGGSFYKELYGKTTIGTDSLIRYNKAEDQKCTTTSNNCIYDICASECDNNATSFNCRTCRLAEKIWGNCEAEPNANISEEHSHNRIMVPTGKSSILTTENTSTLLSWFATNTGTADRADNCRDTTCAAGYSSRVVGTKYMCVNASATTPGDGSPDGIFCPDISQRIDVLEKLQNCCGRGEAYGDIHGNICCEINTIAKITYFETESPKVEYFFTQNAKDEKSGIKGNVCQIYDAQNIPAQALVRYEDEEGKDLTLICQGDISIAHENDKNVFKCSGRYVSVSNNGEYLDPTKNKTHMYYFNNKGNTVTPTTDGNWGNPAPNAWIITTNAK